MRQWENKDIPLVSLIKLKSEIEISIKMCAIQVPWLFPPNSFTVISNNTKFSQNYASDIIHRKRVIVLANEERAKLLMNHTVHLQNYLNLRGQWYERLMADTKQLAWILDLSTTRLRSSLGSKVNVVECYAQSLESC